ncbi:GerAB/ArcD/ProY family transporter [Brevibacillus sp. TJ4]|uniref:GerAB/ArcD/ProY family transporter n=1 Tax=Brevibacillus sp. TJ4 TaxID=3234853 RepID=UPI003BA245C0
MIKQFTFLQISFTFLMSVGMMNHVLLMPQLIEVSARDSWISVLLASALFLPVFLMIGYIVNKTKQIPMMEWLSKHYGRWVVIPVSVFLVLVLISIVITVAKDMMVWTTSSYLPETPPSVLISLFLALALYSALKGLKSVIITSGILLPIVVLFGEFVMIANYPNKDYSLLFPVFEHGLAPAWAGIVYIGAGLLELLFFVLVQHHVANNVRKRYFIILGLLLAGLALGPTMGAIAAFGPFESSLQRNPAFEQWRLVRIGGYIEHMDFLSIFQWLSGAFIRISFTLYLIRELIPWKRKGLILTVITALCWIVILYPLGDVDLFRILKHYYYPILFVVLLGLTILLFALALYAKPAKEANT